MSHILRQDNLLLCCRTVSIESDIGQHRLSRFEFLEFSLGFYETVKFIVVLKRRFIEGGKIDLI